MEKEKSPEGRQFAKADPKEVVAVLEDLAAEKSRLLGEIATRETRLAEITKKEQEVRNFNT